MHQSHLFYANVMFCVVLHTPVASIRSYLAWLKVTDAFINTTCSVFPVGGAVRERTETLRVTGC